MTAKGKVLLKGGTTGGVYVGFNVILLQYGGKAPAYAFVALPGKKKKKARCLRRRERTRTGKRFSKVGKRQAYRHIKKPQTELCYVQPGGGPLGEEHKKSTGRSVPFLIWDAS